MIGGSLGQLGGLAGKALVMKISKEATEQTQLLIRSALGVAAGGVASGATAAIIKIVDNILKNGYLSKGDIAGVIGNNPGLVDEVWAFLISEKYITILEDQDPQSKQELNTDKAHVKKKCLNLKKSFEEENKPKMDAKLEK